MVGDEVKESFAQHGDEHRDIAWGIDECSTNLMRRRSALLCAMNKRTRVLSLDDINEKTSDGESNNVVY